MTKARTLILDIETAPILANVWRTWKENVGMDQIRADWYILSFSAKWLGAKRVMYFDQSKAKDIEDDTFLMRKLHELLNEADIVVAHNGLHHGRMRCEASATSESVLLAGVALAATAAAYAGGAAHGDHGLAPVPAERGRTKGGALGVGIGGFAICGEGDAIAVTSMT